jgi:F-type H+-transporting ATPase subunit alpha
MKQVAGRLRLDLAQYREIAAFAQFGTELDRATQAQIEKGKRLVEILKQVQYNPIPMEKQVAILYLGVYDHLRDVKVEDCKRFEGEYLQFMESEHADLLKKIKENKALDSQILAAMDEAIATFKKVFVQSE